MKILFYFNDKMNRGVERIGGGREPYLHDA